MAINIIDGFNLNSAVPIDYRIVASNSTLRDAISYKYDGLRVFQQDNRRTYIWNVTTATWSSELLIEGGGDGGYIPKWSSASGLTSSGIYFLSGSSNVLGSVGINTYDPKAIFQISSDSGTSQPLVVHKGSSTILADNWYDDGSEQYFSLSPGSSGVKFRSNGEFWIVNRTGSSDAMNISSDTVSYNTSLVSTPTNINLYRNTSFIVPGSITSAPYIRATSSYSTAAIPDYTWVGSSQTGIYHPSGSTIGVSINSVQRLLLTSSSFMIGSISPASKLHIDSGSSIQNYLKFTAGSTTGTSSNDGFDIGINSSGFPYIISRDGNQLSMSFTSSGTSDFNFGPNTFSILGAPGSNSKTTYGTGYSFSPSFGTPINIYTASVTSTSFISAEVDFTSFVNSYYRYTKYVNTYYVDGSGVLSLIGSSIILDTYNTNANSYISLGTFSTATNQIGFKQTFSTYTSGRSVVNFKLNINKG